MSRVVSDLHPIAQSKALQLVQACKEQGLIIGISECVRTVSEQDALYAKGRTVPGSIVTNCRGVSYSSTHQWFIAFDIFRNDGKGAYNNADGFFDKVGAIGKRLGLEWGGSWKKPVDKPHFQLPDWGSTASRLKSIYGTPNKFKATWNNDSKITVQENASNMTVTKKNIMVIQAWVGTEVDGAWGKNSNACMIKKIQSYFGMKQTGVATDEMYKKITSMKVGSNGELVKCLEGMLFVHGFNPKEFQGNYIDSVAQAVVECEKKYKLSVDSGIAGKQVFKRLLTL